MINITRSVTLRGSGPSNTTLYFPFSLQDVYGNTPDSASGYSQWAFRPGFLNFLGYDPIGPETLLGHAVHVAFKGDSQISVNGWVKGIPPRVGTWIRLVQSDPVPADPPSSVGNPPIDLLAAEGTAAHQAVPAEGTASLPANPVSLIEHLHGGWKVMSPDAAPQVSAAELQGTRFAGQVLARVISATDTSLIIDRPLPFDVRTEWQPELHAVHASLQESGIENLTIEFAEKPYGGHFKEAGHNAVYFSAVHHSWIRNLDIINTDYAIGLNGSHFCTVEGLHLYDSRPRGESGGHHGIDISYGADNLVTNFTFGKEFLHDLSIEWFTHGNVFSDGSGVDMNMDHHRGAAFGNLFTNLHLGRGSRGFASSGAHGRGPHSGAFNAYWNLLSEQCLVKPDADFGHALTFESAQSAELCLDAQQQRLQGLVHPHNLHAAMQVWHNLHANVSEHAEADQPHARA